MKLTTIYLVLNPFLEQSLSSICMSMYSLNLWSKNWIYSGFEKVFCILHRGNNNYANFSVFLEELLLKILLLLWIFWQKISPDSKIMIQLLQIATNSLVVKNKSLFCLFIQFGHFPVIFCRRGHKVAKQWLKYFKTTFLHWLASGDSHLWISAKM